MDRGGDERIIMAKKVMSGAQAVAEAVRLCKPGVIAVYPITPQTIISETIAQMVADGDISAELIMVESEHSAMSACMGASATGVRTYTATASQGLALMHEMLFAASGMRLPVVMTVANRALNSPLNIWNDQQDSFAQRDSGWVQLYVESAQEAFDAQVQAFKIAEEVRLPVMVCLDGYVITHTYEPVELVEQDVVDKFLPKLKPVDTLNPSKPMTLGAVGGPEHYIFFKKQQQEAMEKAAEAIQKANIEYSSAAGRKYGSGLIETSNLEGADSAIITIGSVAGTARSLLEKKNTGLIRMRSLRPFPAEDIRKACEGLKSVGVLEKDVSLGANGALYDEVRAALYGQGAGPKVSGFIAGLGGRDITEKDMMLVLKKIKSGKEGTEWIV
jgi:pyruvate ferredoxin oxidoreductase alpha subunit